MYQSQHYISNSVCVYIKFIFDRYNRFLVYSVCLITIIIYYHTKMLIGFTVYVKFESQIFYLIPNFFTNWGITKFGPYQTWAEHHQP